MFYGIACYSLNEEKNKVEALEHCNITCVFVCVPRAFVFCCVLSQGVGVWK